MVYYKDSYQHLKKKMKRKGEGISIHKNRGKAKGFLWMFYFISLTFLGKESCLALKKGSFFPSLLWAGPFVLGDKSYQGTSTSQWGVISASRMELCKCAKAGRKRPAWDLISFLRSGNWWGREAVLLCVFGIEPSGLWRPQESKVKIISARNI